MRACQEVTTKSFNPASLAVGTSGSTGERLALASDAGTPLVSDPGYRLVRAAIAEGLAVGAVPGPNAAVMALTLSGLPPQPFLFLGFLPPRAGPRAAALAGLRAAERAGLSATLVLYEAPHRLPEMLADQTRKGEGREVKEQLIDDRVFVE